MLSEQHPKNCSAVRNLLQGEKAANFPLPLPGHLPVEKCFLRRQVAIENLFSDLGSVHFTRSPLEKRCLSLFEPRKDSRARKSKGHDDQEEEKYVAGPATNSVDSTNHGLIPKMSQERLSWGSSPRCNPAAIVP